MKKNVLVASIIIIAVVVFGAWLADFGKFWQAGLKESGIYNQGVKEKAVLEINYGDGKIQNFESEFAGGMTALSLLQDAIEELKSKLRTKTYSGTGTLVESIGDKENGQNGKYWLYYVNGELPMVAADKMQIKAGDKVEFKFEKSPF